MVERKGSLRRLFSKKADDRGHLPDSNPPAARNISDNRQIPEIQPRSNDSQERFRKVVRRVCPRSNLSKIFKEEAPLSIIIPGPLANDDHAEKVSHRGSRSMAYTGFEEILIQLRFHVRNLLSSFRIVSLQFPGHPLQVASKDLYFRDQLPKGQVCCVSDERTKHPWFVRQGFLNGSDELSHFLTVQGDLIERNVESSASHRFIGLLDLTALVLDLTSEISPILADFKRYPWVPRHMEDSAPRRTHLAEVNFPESPVVGAIRLLHAFYFIVKPSENGYVITHLAPDLIESIGPEYRDLPTTAFLDLESLSEFLESGGNFCIKVFWELSKVDEWLYCVPNFCPELDCWLCFIVDGSLRKQPTVKNVSISRKL
ncbi:hypothetical protein MMC29_003918 [Sticta canariensis]|nr:hypothetical protein [Sticta canariensis]